MTIDQHIPSYLNIGPYRCLVIYEGQPKTCRQCDSTEHMWNKCPVVQDRLRKRFNRSNQNAEAIIEISDNTAPPPLEPLRPHEPPTAPPAPPQTAPSPPAPPVAQTAEVPGASTIPPGGKASKMASKAVAAGKKSTWRDKASKTKPNVGKQNNAANSD